MGWFGSSKAQKGKEPSQEKHPEISKWSMGVLNDTETMEVPGSVRLLASKRNSPMGIQNIPARMSRSSIATGGPRGRPPHPRRQTNDGEDDKKRTQDGRIILEPQPEDSANDPLNWTSWRRDAALLSLGLYCMVGGGLTPILAAGFTNVADDYDVGVERVSLTTGLFMMGMGIGSVLFSPTAILYGKRPVYLASSILLIACSVWCGSSPNFASLIVARILQGIAVSPIECLPSATIAEIYFLHERAFRIGIYTLLLLGGKNLVPLVSAAIIETLSWRWVFWIVAIIVGFCGILLFFFVPETYWDRAPVPKPRGSSRPTSLLRRFSRSQSRPATAAVPEVHVGSDSPRRGTGLHVGFKLDSDPPRHSQPTSPVSPASPAHSPLSGPAAPTASPVSGVQEPTADHAAATPEHAQVDGAEKNAENDSKTEDQKEIEKEADDLHEGSHSESSNTVGQTEVLPVPPKPMSPGLESLDHPEPLASVATELDTPSPTTKDGKGKSRPKVWRKPTDYFAVDVENQKQREGDQDDVEDGAQPDNQNLPYTHALRGQPAKSFIQQLRPYHGRLTPDNWFKVMLRPFILYTYPSILWSAAVYACSVGWLIVISESVAVIYREHDSYEFTALQTGLVYISPFVGGVLGTAVAGKLSDIVVQKMAARNNGVYEPEFRLVMALPIAITTIMGLMGFGWSAQVKDAWIVPTVFFGIVSFGCSLGSTTAITFCVDSYRQYAGEALVTLNFAKNIFHGLVFSLFVTGWLQGDGPKTVFIWIGVIQLIVLLFTIPMYIYGKRARMWTVRQNYMERFFVSFKSVKFGESSSGEKK